jgi:hypothetical protein
MTASDYSAMCKALLENVRFSEPSAIGSPEGSPFDAIQLAAVVKGQQGQLPASYRTSYVAPLLAALPDVAVQLRQQFDRSTQLGMSSEDALADVRALADTLVGAVRDWGVEAYRTPLRRFAAVVSNLYRSFLGKEQRAQMPLPLIETLPPLVTFGPAPAQGPFTLPVDSVKQFTGASVGIVSLPGCYAQHPILWGALAHETGGHDVLHADPGLLEQLAAGVAKLDGIPQGLGGVWAAWMDETASDVYGLLNLGPAFTIGLLGLLAALGVAHGPGGPPIGAVRTTLPVSNGQLIDPHPVDLLRLYLAMGVIESLEGLSVARRSEWLGLFEAIAGVACGGATAIAVRDVGPKQVIQQIPLATAASAARTVGKYVATAKLAALGGASIQDIETWDDMDDTAASNIAAAAPTSSIVSMGDDAQLLAGATMALMTAPHAYAQITAQLGAALDDSFARDPIFGTVTAQSSLAFERRGRMLARTPASPRFPITLG